MRKLVFSSIVLTVVFASSLIGFSRIDQILLADGIGRELVAAETAGGQTDFQPIAADLMILETGEFHEDEVSSKTGEKWFGVYKEGTFYKLSPSIIRVESVVDSIIDNDGEKTGKRVSVSGNSEPIFLIRSLQNPRHRVIPTVFVGESSLVAKYDAKFQLGRKSYRLRISSDSFDAESGKKVSRLILSLDGEEQILGELVGDTPDGYWTIFWVGDLDNDGRLDFYLDMSSHDNVMEKKLFLSSRSSKHALVGLAANFRTVGC